MGSRSRFYRRQAVRRPHGTTVTVGPWGELRTGDILTCCHCRFTWEVVVGSGRVRGWCERCQAVTCGKPTCHECVPFERRLENIEAGRPVLTPTPTLILVPELPPGYVAREHAHLFVDPLP